MQSAGEMVFVYGTLRRGASNHFRMAGAEFVAAGSVRGRLYRIDWFPGLLLDGAAGLVHGEVFAVGPELLAELDRFEGVSADENEGGEYRRVRAQVSTGAGETVSAWIWEWLGPVEEAGRITSGDWLLEPGVQ